MRTHSSTTTAVAAARARRPVGRQRSGNWRAGAPRWLAAVLILAALGLAGPQVVRAQTITPTIPAAVATANSNLQSAIQTGGDVPGALGSYNAAVSTAASPN